MARYFTNSRTFVDLIGEDESQVLADNAGHNQVRRLTKEKL
jgi:hypothetical protein